MKRFRFVPMVALGAGLVAAAWAADSANKVGGGYLVYPNKQGTVVFSHLAHNDVAGFKCEDCHDAIVGKQKTTMTMADITAGKACGKCHNGTTKAPKSGEVAFAVTDCARCHMPDTDVVLKTKGPGSVKFSHAKHTGSADGENAGFACGECHTKLFQPKAGTPIGMKFPHKETACATCHDGKHTSPSGKTAKATSAGCMTCHKPA